MSGWMLNDLWKIHSNILGSIVSAAGTARLEGLSASSLSKVPPSIPQGLMGSFRPRGETSPRVINLFYQVPDGYPIERFFVHGFGELAPRHLERFFRSFWLFDSPDPDSVVLGRLKRTRPPPFPWIFSMRMSGRLVGSRRKGGPARGQGEHAMGEKHPLVTPTAAAGGRGADVPLSPPGDSSFRSRISPLVPEEAARNDCMYSDVGGVGRLCMDWCQRLDKMVQTGNIPLDVEPSDDLCDVVQGADGMGTIHVRDYRGSRFMDKSSVVDARKRSTRAGSRSSKSSGDRHGDSRRSRAHGKRSADAGDRSSHRPALGGDGNGYPDSPFRYILACAVTVGRVKYVREISDLVPPAGRDGERYSSKEDLLKRLGAKVLEKYLGKDGAYDAVYVRETESYIIADPQLIKPIALAQLLALPNWAPGVASLLPEDVGIGVAESYGEYLSEMCSTAVPAHVVVGHAGGASPSHTPESCAQGRGGGEAGGTVRRRARQAGNPYAGQLPRKAPRRKRAPVQYRGGVVNSYEVPSAVFDSSSSEEGDEGAVRGRSRKHKGGSGSGCTSSERDSGSENGCCEEESSESSASEASDCSDDTQSSRGSASSRKWKRTDWKHALDGTNRYSARKRLPTMSWARGGGGGAERTKKKKRNSTTRPRQFLGVLDAVPTEYGAVAGRNSLRLRRRIKRGGFPNQARRKKDAFGTGVSEVSMNYVSSGTFRRVSLSGAPSMGSRPASAMSQSRPSTADRAGAMSRSGARGRPSRAGRGRGTPSSSRAVDGAGDSTLVPYGDFLASAGLALYGHDTSPRKGIVHVFPPYTTMSSEADGLLIDVSQALPGIPALDHAALRRLGMLATHFAIPPLVIPRQFECVGGTGVSEDEFQRVRVREDVMLGRDTTNESSQSAQAQPTRRNGGRRGNLPNSPYSGGDHRSSRSPSARVVRGPRGGSRGESRSSSSGGSGGGATTTSPMASPEIACVDSGREADRADLDVAWAIQSYWVSHTGVALDGMLNFFQTAVRAMEQVVCNEIKHQLDVYPKSLNLALCSALVSTAARQQLALSSLEERLHERKAMVHLERRRTSALRQLTAAATAVLVGQLVRPGSARARDSGGAAGGPVPPLSLGTGSSGGTGTVIPSNGLFFQPSDAGTMLLHVPLIPSVLLLRSEAVSALGYDVRYRAALSLDPLSDAAGIGPGAVSPYRPFGVFSSRSSSGRPSSSGGPASRSSGASRNGMHGGNIDDGAREVVSRAGIAAWRQGLGTVCDGVNVRNGIYASKECVAGAVRHLVHSVYGLAEGDMLMYAARWLSHAGPVGDTTLQGAISRAGGVDATPPGSRPLPALLASGETVQLMPFCLFSGGMQWESDWGCTPVGIRCLTVDTLAPGMCWLTDMG